MEPITSDLKLAVEMGGPWLGPMLWPVAAALWTVVGPVLVAIYQSLVLASAQGNVGQALGAVVGTLVLVAMVVFLVVVLLAAIVAILSLILGISFLVTVLRLIIREPAPA